MLKDFNICKVLYPGKKYIYNINPAQSRECGFKYTAGFYTPDKIFPMGRGSMYTVFGIYIKDNYKLSGI